MESQQHQLLLPSAAASLHLLTDHRRSLWQSTFASYRRSEKHPVASGKRRITACVCWCLFILPHCSPAGLCSINGVFFSSIFGCHVVFRARGKFCSPAVGARPSLVVNVANLCFQGSDYVCLSFPIKGELLLEIKTMICDPG